MTVIIGFYIRHYFISLSFFIFRTQLFIVIFQVQCSFKLTWIILLVSNSNTYKITQSEFLRFKINQKTFWSKIKLSKDVVFFSICLKHFSNLFLLCSVWKNQHSELMISGQRSNRNFIFTILYYIIFRLFRIKHSVWCSEFHYQRKIWNWKIKWGEII
jgi:hypothetical protein